VLFLLPCRCQQKRLNLRCQRISWRKTLCEKARCYASSRTGGDVKLCTTVMARKSVQFLFCYLFQRNYFLKLLGNIFWKMSSYHYSVFFYKWMLAISVYASSNHWNLPGIITERNFTRNDPFNNFFKAVSVIYWSVKVHLLTSGACSPKSRHQDVVKKGSNPL